jgi:hypothetical protein
MTFDGKKYKLANPVQAAAYHPHANMQAQVIGENLRNSYFAAQQNARFIGQTIFSASTRYNAGNEGAFHIRSASLQKLCLLNAYMAEGFTHLVASIGFGLQSAQAASAYHRLVITNTSAETLTGNTVKTEMEAGYPQQLVYTAGNSYGRGYRQGQALCEVELEKIDGVKITLNETFQIELQGHAKNEVDWEDVFPDFAVNDLSVVEAEVYRPFFATFWLESRSL